MFASMPVFGIITASDMPTGPAPSKMDPRVTDGQTLLAALAGWRNGLNRIEMRALLTSFRHGRSPHIHLDVVSSRIPAFITSSSLSLPRDVRLGSRFQSRMSTIDVSPKPLPKQPARERRQNPSFQKI